MFDYSGPMLWIAQFFHDAGTPSDKLVGGDRHAWSSACAPTPLDEATLDAGAREDALGALRRASRASRASAGRTCWRRFALFDDDPARINRLEAEFAKVTPALLQETAREYLRPGNRTVYTITPGKAEPAKEQGRVSREAPAQASCDDAMLASRCAASRPRLLAPSRRSRQKQAPPAAGTPKNFALPTPHALHAAERPGRSRWCRSARCRR